jgi:hypothetical protein
MNSARIFNLLAVIFGAAFVVAAAGVIVHYVFWDRPAKACSEAKFWWDPDGRACARPVDLAMLTGRPLGQKRTPEQVEAARKKAGFKPHQPQPQR